MQLKVYFLILILIAQDSIVLISSFTNNKKLQNKLTKNKGINNVSKKLNWKNSKNINKNLSKRENYHEQSFLEIKSDGENPIFSFGNFDFVIANQLLSEILKNQLSSENSTNLTQECFKRIYYKQSQFYKHLERFYSLMFAFYVSEKFVKNTPSANENFINSINQIKKILNEAQDNYVFLNGFRRNCFDTFKFNSNFNKDDILRILTRPEYFGDINNTLGAQPFIDSQFSIYRDRLPNNAFKLFNYVSRSNNGSSPSIGNNSLDKDFIQRLMVDTRNKGLSSNLNEINSGFYNGRYEFDKKHYLYKPNITYDLEKNLPYNANINNNFSNVNYNNKNRNPNNFNDYNNNNNINNNINSLDNNSNKQNNNPNNHSDNYNKGQNNLINNEKNDSNKSDKNQKKFENDKSNKTPNNNSNGNKENEGNNGVNTKDSDARKQNKNNDFEKSNKNKTSNDKNKNLNSNRNNKNINSISISINKKDKELIESLKEKPSKNRDNSKSNNPGKQDLKMDSSKNFVNSLINKLKDIKEKHNSDSKSNNKKAEENINDNKAKNPSNINTNNNHNKNNDDTDCNEKTENNKNKKQNNKEQNSFKDNNKEEEADCILDKDVIEGLDNQKQILADGKKQSNRNPANEFNLLVFGNLGEIEYFSNLTKLAYKSKNATADLLSNMQNESLSFDNQNNICYINLNNKQQKLEINSNKGLVNLGNLISNAKTIQKLNSANSLFFIGEIANIAIPNEIYSSIIKNNDIKIKEKLHARVQCAWNIFMDSLSKTGFAQSLEDGSFLLSQEVEILPGANILKENLIEKNIKIFDAIKRGKNMNQENTQIITDDDSEPTKHSEANKYRKNSETLFDSPKLTTIKFKNFSIQFLDFNSYLLVCLSEETEVEYNKCLIRNNLIYANDQTSATNKNKDNDEDCIDETDLNNKTRLQPETNISGRSEITEIEKGEATEANKESANEKEILDENFLQTSEKYFTQNKNNKNNMNNSSIYKSIKAKTNNKINAKVDKNYKNNKCSYSNKALFSFANAKKYAWKVYKAINQKFAFSNAQFQVWKFMRAVHAPISSSNGDNEFYFKMLKVTNEKGSEEVVSLIETMRQKGVNLFIASQAKSSAVWAFPYTRLFKKPEKNCAKKITKNFGCIYSKFDKVFKQKADFLNSEKCVKEQNNIELSLPVNFKSFDKKQNILYVFNIGNSGAALDEIQKGKASNGYVIWERIIAYKDNKKKGNIQFANYGFANFSISKDYIDVEFYELNVNNEIVRTALISVAEAIMPDQVIINNIIDENFCAKTPQ